MRKTAAFDVDNVFIDVLRYSWMFEATKKLCFSLPPLMIWAGDGALKALDQYLIALCIFCQKDDATTSFSQRSNDLVFGLFQRSLPILSCLLFFSKLMNGRFVPANLGKHLSTKVKAMIQIFFFIWKEGRGHLLQGCLCKKA